MSILLLTGATYLGMKVLDVVIWSLKRAAPALRASCQRGPGWRTHGAPNSETKD